MIYGISIVSVWVLDQDSAKEFYTEKLVLMDPQHSMLDEETAQQVRSLVAKGALSPGVMATSDCKADHDTLAERGVEFTQPPAERPYGVEAIMRDDSGNWFSFTQRKGW